MILRDGMTVKPGERVEVYYNIQKGGFSIKSLDKRNRDRGKVVAYAANVMIEEATFHINENKLRKIHEQNRKTVYAVVRGYLVHCDEADDTKHRRGYCNPFTTGKFIDWDTGEQLFQAARVYFYDKFLSYLPKGDEQ